MEITPSRLELARRRNGITKTNLSRLVGVSTRILLAYETGERKPSPETLQRLVEALNFPKEFFTSPDLEDPPIDGASFRALSRLTAGQRDSALAAGSLAIALSDWINERFDVPDPSVPRLRAVDPETAAEYVRAEWGLANRPVSNCIHLLEAHGVRVFSLAEENAEVDAYSFWRGQLPYIFLNTQKTAEHSRMDAAHELGHLVMHWRHETPRGREYEREAEAFASAFLMPSSSVVAGAPRGANLDGLVKAKRRWKVSAAALAYRMHGLGLLSEWQYRTIFVELARRGFSRSEPSPIERETSQVLGKVFAALRGEGVSKQAVARDLRIPESELDGLVFGLVLMGLEGGGAQASESGKRPELRVI